MGGVCVYDTGILNTGVHGAVTSSLFTHQRAEFNNQYRGHFGDAFQDGFLVHDSHLFDAMDERQIANAIEVGARLSQQHGFQYIITMNSDRIPYHDFSPVSISTVTSSSRA